MTLNHYHLGFCQQDAAAVHKLYADMKAGGENIVREPDGNKIEISWNND